MCEINQYSTTDRFAINTLGCHLAQNSFLQRLELSHKIGFQLLVWYLIELLKLFLVRNWALKCHAISVGKESLEKSASSVFALSSL